jgi:diaminopimelate decarboxylase
MPTAGFEYRDDGFFCEDVPLDHIAERFGTPCYVYSAGAITTNYGAYGDALAGLPHDVHYAAKANGTLGILSLLAGLGAGFDIVSGGELFRVLKAGGDPAKVVFSGVGKTAVEMEYALQNGIGSFNCESEGEVALLNETAGRLNKQPVVALRVNPDISADTHPYIATGLRDHKFGIPFEVAERIYTDSARFPHLRFEGVSCHIGSQIFDTSVFFDALEKVLNLVAKLRAAGVSVRQLDLGGGLGIAYRPDETTPSISDYAAGLARALHGKDLRLMIEPGRSIVGQAGVLLTRVIYRKPADSKQFFVVDAAMNDLIRPALYQSHHEIVPVTRRAAEMVTADVVGPVCETGDFLARDRQMPAVDPGELLAICTAGAYGFVLASNYNGRPRAPEVLVEGGEARLIRERETYDDLIRGETAAAVAEPGS